MIDENASNICYKMNGFSQNRNNNQSNSGNRSNDNVTANKDKTNEACYNANSKNQTNTIELSNGVHSSPLRSQLGLNLKAPTVSVKKVIEDFQVSRSRRNNFFFVNSFVH